VISAVDTNVLLDVLVAGAAHVEEAEAALQAAHARGSVVISEVAYAELVAFFESAPAADHFLNEVGIRLVDSSRRTWEVAGVAWRSYAAGRTSAIECTACGRRRTLRCDRCGTPLRSRQHLLTDFAIGAHALTAAGSLVTRDRAFFRRHFPSLLLS